jgi:hypothetical protein
MKKLIRQIVLSETYRRASLTNDQQREAGEAVDQEAIWLWRRQPKRVQAEVLRDSMLSMAGSLAFERYGPGYRDVVIQTVGAAHYYRAEEVAGPAFDRRTIYRWRPRGGRGSLLDAFDCPDPSAAAPERAVTTTPTQALSLWNQAFVLRMSHLLAEKVRREAGDDVSQQVRCAWRTVLLREPTLDELSESVTLANEFGLPSVCRVTVRGKSPPWPLPANAGGIESTWATSQKTKSQKTKYWGSHSPHRAAAVYFHSLPRTVSHAG